MTVLTTYLTVLLAASLVAASMRLLTSAEGPWSAIVRLFVGLDTARRATLPMWIGKPLALCSYCMGSVYVPIAWALLVLPEQSPTAAHLAGLLLAWLSSPVAIRTFYYTSKLIHTAGLRAHIQACAATGKPQPYPEY